jgi:hypothetical protein
MKKPTEGVLHTVDLGWGFSDLPRGVMFGAIPMMSRPALDRLKDSLASANTKSLLIVRSDQGIARRWCSSRVRRSSTAIPVLRC